jgi:hypothetical protein
MLRVIALGNSPLVTRDVEVRAQRTPDVAWVHAILDGLRGGAPAETGQYMVDQHRLPTHRSELQLDKLVELRQPHESKLRERVMAHPYRILDTGH